MLEGMNMGPSPEERKRLQKERQDKEDAEQLAGHFAIHPEQINMGSSPEEPKWLRKEREDRENDEQLVVEFETMIAEFESKHSFEALLAIVELSPDLKELFLRADDLADPQRIENDIKTYEKHNPSYVSVYKAKIAAALATIQKGGEDAEKFKLRIAAKKDLAPIVEG